jgi:hypothetical protein
MSAVLAAAFLANTMTPEVSLSSLCTTAARPLGLRLRIWIVTMSYRLLDLEPSGDMVGRPPGLSTATMSSSS